MRREKNLKRYLVIWMEGGGAFPIKGIKGIKGIKIGCYARMAEWSKAVDLSPTISGCAGSIPASRIFFCFAFIAQR